MTKLQTRKRNALVKRIVKVINGQWLKAVPFTGNIQCQLRLQWTSGVSCKITEVKISGRQRHLNGIEKEIVEVLMQHPVEVTKCLTKELQQNVQHSMSLFDAEIEHLLTDCDNLADDVDTTRGIFWEYVLKEANKLMKNNS